MRGRKIYRLSLREATRQGYKFEDIDAMLADALQKNLTERIEKLKEQLDLPDST